MSAALRLSAEVQDAVIVCIVCDRGDRYLSTGTPVLSDTLSRLYNTGHSNGSHWLLQVPAAGCEEVPAGVMSVRSEELLTEDLPAVLVLSKTPILHMPLHCTSFAKMP